MQIPVDKNTGQAKGFAYLEFADKVLHKIITSSHKSLFFYVSIARIFKGKIRVSAFQEFGEKVLHRNKGKLLN
jgi:hypothetical protein